MMGGAGFDLGLGLYGLRGWGEVVKYDAVAMTMVSVVKVEKSGCQYIILCASCMLSCVCTDVYNVYKYVAYSTLLASHQTRHVTGLSQLNTLTRTRTIRDSYKRESPNDATIHKV